MRRERTAMSIVIGVNLGAVNKTAFSGATKETGTAVSCNARLKSVTLKSAYDAGSFGAAAAAAADAALPLAPELSGSSWR